MVMFWDVAADAWNLPVMILEDMARKMEVVVKVSYLGPKFFTIDFCSKYLLKPKSNGLLGNN